MAKLVGLAEPCGGRTIVGCAPTYISTMSTLPGVVLAILTTLCEQQSVQRKESIVPSNMDTSWFFVGINGGIYLALNGDDIVMASSRFDFCFAFFSFFYTCGADFPGCPIFGNS